MPNSIDGKSKLLLLLLVVVIALSVWLTYVRTVVVKDFQVEQSEEDISEEI